MKEQIRNIIILFGSTLSVMAGAIITPVLPQMTEHFSNHSNIEFLTKLMISLPPLFIALFSPIAGYLLERFGRKPVLLASALLYGLAGSSGFYLDSIELILIFRALFGISISGIVTGFIVVIGDLFKDSKMNKFIGLQGAAMSFGGVAYLLIGGKLGDYSWEYPFLVYLVSFLLAIGLIIFLSETKSKTEKKELTNVRFTKPIILINITAGYVMVLYLMVPTQLPFLITNNFEGLTASNIGIFLSIWILFSSLASLIYSKLRKIISYSNVYSIGFFIWAIGHLLIFYSTTEIMLIVALIFIGFGNGLVVPNLKAHLLAESPSMERGRHSGFLTMSFYIGQFFSPILVQPLLLWFDISIIFVVFGIFTLFTSVFFFINEQLLKKSNLIQ